MKARMHTYGVLYRPVSSMTIPAGWKTEGTHEDFRRFGTVTYERKLNVKECIRSGLIEIVNESDLAKLLIGKIDYLDEWAEDYDNNPLRFEMGVECRMERLNVHADLKKVAAEIIRMHRKSQ